MRERRQEWWLRKLLIEMVRDNVRHLLDGQAKAMVVTGSRQEAVRYQLAADQYIRETGYDDVHPLVVFSGSIPADEYIPVEVTETSSHLDPGLRGPDHREAFDTDDYNVMSTAELTDVSDPNVVYDLLRRLNDVRIYEWHEVASFARAFFNPKAKSSKLSYWVDPARQPGPPG